MALVFAQASALAASPSELCNLILTEKQFTNFKEHVRESRLNRTEPLRAGQPYLNSKSGKSVDVLEGINRELAKPILDASKRDVILQLNKITALWFEAVRADLLARYKASGEFKQSIPLDMNELPLTPLVQNNLEIARQVVGAAKKKLGAVDIESQVAKALIENLRKKYFNELNKQANEAIKAQTDALAASLNQVSPDWNVVKNLARPLIEAMARELNETYGLNGKNKPFAAASRKVVAMEWMQEVANRWSTAVTGNIKRRQYERSKSGEGDHPLATAVQSIRNAMARKLETTKKKMPANDLATNVEIALAVSKIEAIQRTFEEKVESIAESLAAARDWQTAEQLVAEIANEFRAQLEVSVPVVDPSAVNIESPFAIFAAAVEATRMALPEPQKAQLNKDGIAELLMPDLGVRAYYDVELATVVLESNRGLLPNDKGILLALDHGDGSTVSNASSWKYIIPNLVKSNFNTFAMNLPGAGIGTELTGLFPNVELLDVRFNYLRSRADAEGKGWMPLVHLGRSLSATRGFAHALLRDGPDNPVAAYFEMSFSNPFKIQEQLELVQKQIDDGAEMHLVPDVMKKVVKIGAQTRKVLKKLEKQDPQRLKRSGLAMLFFQGRGDRDSGSAAIPDLVAFRDQYAQAALIYEFDFPLEKYNIPGIEKMPEDHFEGQHNLLSNFKNMDVEEALRKFPGIDPADRPMMADQNFEVIGAMYAFGDVLAQNSVALPQMQQRAKIWREYRKQLTGSEDGSLLDWYAQTNGITKAEVAAAKATERGGRANVLKRNEEFKERAIRFYQRLAVDIAAEDAARR